MNQPSPPSVVAASAAAAAAKPSPVAQRKVWAEPGTVQLPKQYDATTSVIKGMSLVVAQQHNL